MHQKAQKFRDVSVWKNILRNLAKLIIIDDQQNEHGRHKRPVERIVWFVIHVVAVLGMVLLMLDITLVYKKSPTVTMPETKLYPMRKINYPAIAICNINRISQKAILNFAEELLELESTTFTINLTLPDLTRMLNLLGQLYLYEIDEADSEMTNLLHTILERGYNGYNVNRIMKRLSPKCRYMIQKCSWKGHDQVCDEIFLLRKTQDGYCCTFNYARRNNGFGSAQNDVFTSQHIERTTNIGPQYGLSVFLNPQLDDYVYKILPINGFKILIYDSLDYPDVSSGNVREILISSKMETYIDLDAIMFYSTKGVQKYDILERDCLFQTEQSKIFHGYYSYSDCIVHCRIRDMFQLCNCVPFFYPLLEDVAHARVCNLKDLSCLKKYRDKWRNIKPQFENHRRVSFNENEFEATSNYLNCDCLPSCTDIMYTVQSSNIPLSLSVLQWGRKKYPMKNNSVVHIYFGKNGAIRLRQDVLFYWYELMSNYGGVCSLFLGISIINVIEILYKLIIRICRTDATNQSAIRIEEMNKKNQDVAWVTTVAVRPVTISEATNSFQWQELTGALPKKQSDSFNLLLKPLFKERNVHTNKEVS